VLEKAIVDNPPVVIRDGGVIRRGYDETLDELTSLSENAGAYLVQVEERERERTGISTLKVGYNRVHGYYIEISRSQSDQAPTDYIRRQTLKNAERFITPELKEFEDKALSAKSRALAREKGLYDELVEQIASDIGPLQDTAAALCELDVLGNFAERAQTLRFNPPNFSETPGLEIQQGATRSWNSSRMTLLSPMTCIWTTSAACSSLPAPTWAVSPPICDRRR